MAKKVKKEKTNSKQESYARKQEERGDKLVKWIIGGLIVLGLIFAIYSATIMP